MMRLVFVFALFAFSLISVHGASVGHRMRRESCSVMMIRTSNCSNHGYCVSDKIGPHCVCYEGWGGHLCQNVVNRGPQGSSPLTDDDNDDDDDDDDSTTEQPAAQTTEEAEPGVTTQEIREQTTADQADDDDDDDDDDEVMRTERPQQPTEGDRDGAIGGVVNEDDRLAILCDDLYSQTNTCSNRQGHCSLDSIGAFCQCNTGFLGIACQYRAENVAGVLEAIVEMMRDPHYRVIGGSSP